MKTIKKLKRNFTVWCVISVAFVMSFSLVLNIASVGATCVTVNGTQEGIEDCDGGSFRGGATTCADVGDTTATSTNALVCAADCTINWVASNCAGGFVDPTPPANVPQDLETAIMNATNWLLGFVAMIAVLAIVWGGINYIGSVGDEEKVRTAKKTITYGIIGVVIAGFAYAIVNVVVTVIL